MKHSSSCLIYYMKSWSYSNDEDLRPFHSRRNELTAENRCLLWGMRVVIPRNLRDAVLQELCQGHAGIVRMKPFARSYMWWPGIDQSIEKLTKSCSGCQHHQKMPKAAPLHLWEWPSSPWQWLHINFAGPFLETMFLVVIDAHSKWPEVIPMSSTYKRNRWIKPRNDAVALYEARSWTDCGCP